MPRDITIRPVLNGFVLAVGCQTIVIANAQELGKQITAYYLNPEQTEAFYLKTKVNDTMEPQVPQPPSVRDCGITNQCVESGAPLGLRR